MNDLVVVLVLNYNQYEYTVSCINSVLESDYDNFKIVLIDNGSSNDDVTQLRNHLPTDPRLIFKEINPNIGMVKGYNLAFEEASKLKPMYYMVMNNDTILDKLAIAELVATCKDYDNKAHVTGKVYHYDEPEVLQFVGYEMTNKRYLMFKAMGMDELDTGQYDTIEERDLNDDVFALYPAALYDKIGAYSPYFWLNSVQADLGLRSKKAGYKLVYTYKAKLWHKGSVSFGGRGMNPKLAYMTSQGALILKYLHLSKSTFLVYYFRVTLGVLRTLIKSVYLYLFKGKNIFEYAWEKFREWAYFNKWVFLKNEYPGL